jgi:hypothetical protein
MKTLKTLVVSVLVSVLLLLPLSLSALNLVLEMRDDAWLFEMHHQIITLQDDMKGLKSTTTGLGEISNMLGALNALALQCALPEIIKAEKAAEEAKIALTAKILEDEKIAEEAKREKEKKSE